jgi:hypothetical protein
MDNGGYLHLTDSDLIDIVPVEFEGRRGNRNPRIRRHWKLVFHHAITLEKLEYIAQNTLTKQRVRIHEVGGRYLVWRYPRKPMLIYDQLERKLKTTKSEEEKYGERACMQTAAIFVKLLTSKKYRLASSIRRSYTIDKSRIGYSEDDRAITYRAAEMLLKYHKRRKNRP